MPWSKEERQAIINMATQQFLERHPEFTGVRVVVLPEPDEEGQPEVRMFGIVEGGRPTDKIVRLKITQS